MSCFCELWMNVREHEYGCLGAGGDGEILEEWRMERPGKSRGSHDDEEGRTMGGRFKGLLRGQFRKIGILGKGCDEERMGRVRQKCVNVQILILQLTLSLKSVRCDSFEIVEMTSEGAVPLCGDHDHAVRCAS